MPPCAVSTSRLRKPMATEALKKRPRRPLEHGAGGGNRTRDSCLEGKGITIMQRPRSSAFLRRGGAHPWWDARRHRVGRAGFEPAYRFREPGLQPGAINPSTTDPRWGPAQLRVARGSFLPCRPGPGTARRGKLRSAPTFPSGRRDRFCKPAAKAHRGFESHRRLILRRPSRSRRTRSVGCGRGPWCRRRNRGCTARARPRCRRGRTRRRPSRGRSRPSDRRPDPARVPPA